MRQRLFIESVLREIYWSNFLQVQPESALHTARDIRNVSCSGEFKSLAAHIFSPDRENFPLNGYFMTKKA